MTRARGGVRGKKKKPKRKGSCPGKKKKGEKAGKKNNMAGNIKKRGGILKKSLLGDTDRFGG